MKCDWRRIGKFLTGGRTRALEEEIARLREENRALVNSILGLAGIPPMPRSVRQNAALRHARELSGHGFSHAAKETSHSGISTPRGVSAARPKTDFTQNGDAAATDERVVPLRRRSWQQLGRAREIEDARAARRERETDVEMFPAPSNIVPRRRGPQVDG